MKGCTLRGVLAKQPVTVSLCALPPRSSDVYLELNLSEEARNIAHEGHCNLKAGNAV